MTNEYQVTSGFGPAECELAVAKFAEFAREKLQCGLVASTDGCRPGTYRSVVLSTPWREDEDEPPALEPFVGSVLWTCRSPFRPMHKRKNWFIRVTRNAAPVENPYHVKQLWNERYVRFETFRCSGNGGQNVNKVETGVRASYGAPYMGFEPVTVVCTTHRTQLANKREAVRLLRELVKGQARANRNLKRNERWQEHARLERGHPVAVFEGEKFVRVR